MADEHTVNDDEPSPPSPPVAAGGVTYLIINTANLLTGFYRCVPDFTPMNGLRTWTRILTRRLMMHLMTQTGRWTHTRAALPVYAHVQQRLDGVVLWVINRNDFPLVNSNY